MTHTPGPWIAVTDTCNVLSTDPETIVAQAWYNGDYRRQEANASLIAAAPDLLAALEDCANWLDTNSNKQRESYLKARAAIAKAKGEA